MARRATELNEDAKFRLNGINNLERVFRGAHSKADIPSNGRHFTWLPGAGEQALTEPRAVTGVFTHTRQGAVASSTSSACESLFIPQYVPTLIASGSVRFCPPLVTTSACGPATTVGFAVNVSVIEVAEFTTTLLTASIPLGTVTVSPL